MSRRRRETLLFSLSFLDAITCGFGAIVLFFMIIQANVNARRGQLTGDLQGEVDRLEEEVLEGVKNLVELRNSARETEDRLVEARGSSRRVLDEIRRTQEELASYDASTLARREHINRLQSDLRSLEEAAKRLSALAPSDETPGDRVRSFVGDGDRQYLTGLKVGGQRIVILVDASASMLGENLVNILRRRNLPDADKVRAHKWRQAVATVDWLTTQLPRDASFQIFTFNTAARPVIDGSEGEWLDAGDRETLDRAVDALRKVVPDDGTNLYQAFTALDTLRPPPDNLILLVDGLPTQGRQRTRSGMVTAKQRARLFEQAVESLRRSLPVNVILFPMEGDPAAASAYWRLALATHGSFLSPSEDWP